MSCRVTSLWRDWDVHQSLWLPSPQGDLSPECGTTSGGGLALSTRPGLPCPLLATNPHWPGLQGAPLTLGTRGLWRLRVSIGVKHGPQGAASPPLCRGDSCPSRPVAALAGGGRPCRRAGGRAHGH